MLRIGASAVVAVLGYLSEFLQWGALEPLRSAVMDMFFLGVIPVLNIQINFEALVIITAAVVFYAIHRVRKLFIESYTDFFEDTEGDSPKLKQA